MVEQLGVSGKLTCYKWNGSSTVDYGIVQRNIFNNVDFFKVHNLEGHVSDHCPISLGLKCRFYNDSVDSSNIHNLHLGFKWNKQLNLYIKQSYLQTKSALKLNTF